jgi:hypothetical protein
MLAAGVGVWPKAPEPQVSSQKIENTNMKPILLARINACHIVGPV